MALVEKDPGRHKMIYTPPDKACLDNLIATDDDLDQGFKRGRKLAPQILEWLDTPSSTTPA